MYCLRLEASEGSRPDAALQADGWKHVRTSGSHRHYKHSAKPNVVTIPGHPGDDVQAGTLKSILKAAGLENKKLRVKYAVLFERAKANWTAYVPDPRGCMTTGETLEQTEIDIREAIEGHLRTLREFGDPVPQPTRVAKEVEISAVA